MFTDIFNFFVKITAYPVQKLCFRTKVYFEDKSVQGRKIRGGAVIVSNHTSVFDYAVYLFVFFGRTLRVQMAEVLFNKQPLGIFLKALGGIRVNRDAHSLDAVSKSEEVIRRGGVVGVFPEGRLPLKGEQRPLPFKEGAALLALSTGAPVIPVYTNGSYFAARRARVIIGKPIYPSKYTALDCSDREKVAGLNTELRERIIQLGRLLDEKTAKQ